VAERFGRLCITVLKRDDFQLPADKAAAELEVLLRRQVAQNAVALPGHVHGNLIRHYCRRRARARRIGGHVQVGNGSRLMELRLSSKSSAVWPGKPAITSAPMAASGIASRILPIFST